MRRVCRKKEEYKKRGRNRRSTRYHDHNEKEEGEKMNKRKVGKFNPNYNKYINNEI